MTSHQIFDDHVVRIETMLWLPALGVDEDNADALLEGFIEDINDASDVALEKMPRLKKAIANDLDMDELAYAAYESIVFDLRMKGFLFKVATPVMTPLKSGGRSFSWGLYNTQWRYAGTLDEVAQAAVDFATHRRAAEDAKAAAAAKTTKGPNNDMATD